MKFFYLNNIYNFESFVCKNSSFNNNVLQLKYALKQHKDVTSVTYDADNSTRFTKCF